MATKKLKTLTTSTRKKSSTSVRSRKAASKAATSTTKSKAAKKKVKDSEDHKRLIELTLKAFQMAYEANQRGEFRRL